MPNSETAAERRAKPAPYTGRARIRVPFDRVDATNVAEALALAMPFHASNVAQIQYLWDYYRGAQPVLGRVKDVRPEINNRIVENHAKEIVDFKVGYQLAEPMQYVLRNHDGTTGPLPDEGEGESEPDRTSHFAEINELNTLMFADGKQSTDRELFEWLCVCGVGYRMVEAAAPGADAPFEQRCLDPRSAFSVESASYRHEPLMGCWTGLRADGSFVVNAWTPEALYVVVDGVLESELPHTYGRIPIVEYELNSARMGAFEPALPLLDAINTLESNRIDGVEQTVQSLMKFVNCEIDEAGFEAMLRLGAVKVSSPDERLKADVDFIRNDLNQTQTQVTKDDLYQAVVNICGMPNRNGTSGSSSDTGAAVLLRDGWSLAESHAKGYELMFKKAEREFLRLVLEICSQAKDVDIELRLRDIELAFNRRNYENLLVKVQALTGMLPSNFLIHPEVAFRASGLFTDPEAAFLESLGWTEEHSGGETSGVEEGEEPFPAAGSPQQEGDNGPQGPSA